MPTNFMTVSAHDIQVQIAMPKQKTHKGAAKRFRLTGRGKVRRGKAYANHILTKKSPKRKRNLRKGALVSDADAPSIKRLLNV